MKSSRWTLAFVELVRRTLSLACILLLTTTPDAAAQGARVISANSSNNRILAVTFDPPGTTVLNSDANARKSLRSIAIRDDGVDGIHLIACDTLAGQVLFYENASGAGAVIADGSSPDQPELPDGVCLDFQRNLFLVSSGPGESQAKRSQVWTVLYDPSVQGSLPGGYSSPLGMLDDDVHGTTLIDGQDVSLGVELLEDSMIARTAAGVLEAGDLLVLASSPAMLLRYPSDSLIAFQEALRAGSTPEELEPQVLIHPPQSSLSAERKFPDGAEPSGMAFGPDGDLLINSNSGSIFIYGTDGTRRSNGSGFVDFASDLGNGKFKIAVGPQNGGPKAFVANRNGGEVLRFAIQDDGTGVLDAVVAQGVEYPVGITTTTSNSVPTPPGDLVTVSPIELIESTFEMVFAEGLTNAKVQLILDPREEEIETPEDQPLHRSLFLDEVDGSLPHVEIPPYVRAFRRGDPDSGIPTLILIVAETTADTDGIVDHFTDVSNILGHEPDCESPQTSQQSRIFWSPDSNDPPLLEGEVFIDITVGCGSNRGLSRDLSFFLVGVRDTRAVRDIASTKLGSLVQLVAKSDCIDRKVRQTLSRQLESATRSFQKKQYANVIQTLKDFLTVIEKYPGSFSSCADTLGPELRSRAISAVFMLGKL